MAEGKKRPSALSTPRRLSEGEILNILYGTGPAGSGALSTPESRLLALARSEVERHATLRRVALDHLEIDTEEDGWEQRYMARLEETAFPGFGITVGPGRPKSPVDDISSRLNIVATLLTRRDPETGRRMKLGAAAERLARSRLNPAEAGQQSALDAEARRLIDVYKHWLRQFKRRRPG